MTGTKKSANFGGKWVKSVVKVRFLQIPEASLLSKEGHLPNIKLLRYTKFTRGYIEEVLFCGCS